GAALRRRRSAGDPYDQARPGYPQALVGDVLAFAGMASPRTLEIGAGTGKATVAFCRPGPRDPGPGTGGGDGGGRRPQLCRLPPGHGRGRDVRGMAGQAAPASTW